MEQTSQKQSATAKGERSNRKTLEGWVLSDKMDKTRSIRLLRRLQHPLYGKVMTRRTKVYAHDETNDSRQGDRVVLMETRPLSRLKKWRVVKILERARVAAGADLIAGGDAPAEKRSAGS